MKAVKKRTGSRFVWTPDNVASRDMARTVIRTYIEHEQLRKALWTAYPIDTYPPSTYDDNGLHFAEVGAGFGRLAPVLRETASKVTCFEREPHLVEKMQRFLPKVNAVQVNALTNLPADDGSFELVMAFTVLQHMSDRDAVATLAEMARISCGCVLVVEDTDPDHHYVDEKNPTHFTHGRDAGWYSEHLPYFEIVNYWPREVEPGFTYKGVPRPTVGEYMLFERAS